MLNIFLTVLKGLLSIVKIPFFILLGCFTIFFLLCSFWIFMGLLSGKRFKKGQRVRQKKRNMFRRLFIDLPHQFVEDMFATDPEFFKPQGMVIFEGRQGAGKSIGMVEYATRLYKEYPKSICTSNMDYKYQDKALEDWRMLMSYKNGIYGVIVLMDELQNWFSSNDSKNFPPEMLTVITQNRKNRRIILGTAQVFSMLAKAIRTQTTEVRRCSTLLGCLTIVRRFEPILDSEGNVVEWKRRGMYFFVHSKELRESYDTWKVIERLKNVGFKDSVENPELVSNTYILQQVDKKRRP